MVDHTGLSTCRVGLKCCGYSLCINHTAALLLQDSQAMAKFKETKEVFVLAGLLGMQF